MTEFHRMDFYPRDYLADTHHLSTVEHGAYLLLILYYWVHGGPLPDNDAALARIVGQPSVNWKKLRSVIEKFFTISDGSWRHKRIDQELEKARSISSKRRELELQQHRNDRALALQKHPTRARPRGRTNLQQVEVGEDFKALPLPTTVQKESTAREPREPPPSTSAAAPDGAASSPPSSRSNGSGLKPLPMKDRKEPWVFLDAGSPEYEAWKAAGYRVHKFPNPNDTSHVGGEFPSRWPPATVST